MYLHHVPGRLRVKCDRLRREPAALAAAYRRLQGMTGVRTISANRLTGSLLVTYDPNLLSLPDLRQALRRCGFPMVPTRQRSGRATAAVVDDLAGAALQTLLQYLMKRLAGAMLGDIG